MSRCVIKTTPGSFLLKPEQTWHHAPQPRVTERKVTFAPKPSENAIISPLLPTTAKTSASLVLLHFSSSPASHRITASRFPLSPACLASCVPEALATATTRAPPPHRYLLLPSLPAPSSSLVARAASRPGVVVFYPSISFSFSLSVSRSQDLPGKFSMLSRRFLPCLPLRLFNCDSCRGVGDVVLYLSPRWAAR